MRLRLWRQIGTLPIADAVRALKDLPGRKSLVLFASGYPVLLIGSQLERLADQATRAGVTIYTVYAPPQVKFPPKTRPGSLENLAHATGGIFYNPGNGVDQRAAGDLRALNDALDDQNSYYLVGYKPKSGTFDGTFHRIEVRVNGRPGLTVRSHTGFIGNEDRAKETESSLEAAPPGSDTMSRLLLQPLKIAPDSGSGLHVGLTAAFQVNQGKPRVQNVLWIDGRDLTFREDSDRRFKTKLEVLAACYDPDGLLSEHADQLYRLDLDAQQVVEARRSGFTFSFACSTTMPTKWATQAAFNPIPTAHQTRVVVREIGARKLATASEYLTAPNLRSNDLAMSGISIEGFGNVDEEIGKSVFQSVPLGRRIRWSAQVFHAKQSSKTVKLDVGVRLYRNGALIQEKQLSPISSQRTAKNADEVDISDQFELTAAEGGGEYILSITLRDENRGAKDPARQVSQWTMFHAGE